MSGVGTFGRVVSRQAARPSGLLGRIIGRIWVWETAAVNDAALAAVDPQPGEIVLEIGHGPGRLLRRILEAGSDAVGVEVSRMMTRQAHRRNRQAVADRQLRLLLGDGIHLSLADESVDAVVAVHTIYFWPDPQTTFAECARVLSPGGRMVVASRDGAHPLPRRLDPTIYAVPTFNQIEAWMTNAAFDVAAEHTIGDVLVVEAVTATRQEVTR
jgi:ubiquinone/menaquinone biosynthesis C-methylase UbiE